MAGLLRIEAMFPKRSGTELAAELPSTAGNPNGFLRLLKLIDGVITSGGRVRASVDESTPVSATGTVTLTQASLTAGDIVYVGGFALTAVAGTADATQGQWSKDTSSTAAATSLALAINTFAATRQLVSATSSVGVVTITSREPGQPGNRISLLEFDQGGGIARSASALASGASPGALVSVNGTFSGVGTANETLVIGATTITLKAAAANENECTIGASAAATATNMIAVINAHSRLKGLVVASSGGSGIVTVQLQLGGRIGYLVPLTETSAAFAWATASFAPATTEAWKSSPITMAFGAPST